MILPLILIEVIMISWIIAIILTFIYIANGWIILGVIIAGGFVVYTLGDIIIKKIAN